MELRDIEIFLTLAEELHFGRTAERLHLTQGRISQSIKKQERRFGAPLFDRTNRVVRLTELGEQLRADLMPSYRQIRDAVAKAAASGRGIAGVLRAGYSAPWCSDLLVKAVDAFRAENPDCEVEIREVPLYDRFGGLRSGQLDLQLTELPAAEPDIVNGPVLFSHQRALIVPSGHPLAAQETVSLEDLADVPLIDMEGPPRYVLDYHLPARTPSGKPIPRGPSARVWEDVLALVAAGKAVSPSSAWAAEYHARPGTAFVLFRDAPPMEYGLLWSADAETPKLKAFVKAILAVSPVVSP